MKNMKCKNKLFKRLLIFTIVLTIVLTSLQISAISTTDKSSALELKTPRCTFKKIESLKPAIVTTRLTPIPVDTAGVLGTDIFLFGSEDLECQNPTITDDASSKVLVGFEGRIDIFTPPDPYFRYSTDGGTTWLPEDGTIGWALTDAGYDSILPTIDFAGDRGGFGSVLPDYQNNWMTFNFDDIADPNAGDEWQANGWLADVMMDEWHSVDVCGVNSQYAPSDDAYGLAVWTGNTIDGGDNGLWYGWELTDGSEFVVYPSESDPGYDFEADQAVNDVDLSTGMYYQAFYRYDDVGSDPLPDGILLRSAQLDGTDQWVETWTNSGHTPGAEHPDIKADNGNCYLVYEINNGIECLYSNNNGDSFQTATVTNDGGYPSVTAIGESVVVSYIRNGDLYTALSDDGGANWLESQPINDISGSVVEQTHSADVSSMHVTWTDNRDEFNSIYYDQPELPLPIIEIESISGGMGVSAIVKNTGTAEATNIVWSINLEGGVFFGAETTDTIASLAPGDSVEIKSGFVLGLGKTDITVTAGSAVQKASGTVFLFFIIGL